MAGLIDIVPQKETVVVLGVEVTVTGVSMGSAGLIVGRFPELAEMLAQQQFTAAAILGHGPDLVGAIIAAGTGFAGNADAEQIARSLSADDQLRILEPLLRITMPRGLGPFVEALVAVVVAMGIKNPLQGSKGGAVKASGTMPTPSKQSVPQASAA